MNRVIFDNTETYFAGIEVGERLSDGFILVELGEAYAEFPGERLWANPDYITADAPTTDELIAAERRHLCNE